MKQFSYKAKNNTGATTSGLIESISESQAVRLLQEHGLYIISLSEKRSFSFKNMNFQLTKVSQREVATFTRLLSTMMSTGLPLTDALSNLSFQVKEGYFREVIQSILHDIQGGASLSLAMARYPSVFDTLYLNLIKAGEASGKVDDTLLKIADTLEANLDFKSKITGAMIYPAIVVIAMGGIGIFMITTIIPKIAEVYKEFGAELPLPTKVLILISDLITHDSIFVILFLGLLFLGIKTARKNPVTDEMINNLAFKFPVMGPMNEEVNLALINRTLGTLLASGVAILESINIVANTLSNNCFRTGLLQAAKTVEKGLPLSLTIRKNPIFPVMMSQLIAIGEETGTLDQSLMRLAKFYQDSAERKVKTLTTALEPIMILVMGLMVGGLAIAVLLPMFNLVNVIH